jgi:hypothetical protein
MLQGLNFGMIVCSALMIWKTLMVVTNTESPVVVVLRYASFAITLILSLHPLSY